MLVERVSQKVLDISRKLLENVEKDENYEIEEKLHKLQQLRSVLEMLVNWWDPSSQPFCRYGHFSGINRKVQFRLLHKTMDGRELTVPSLLLILKWGGELTPAGEVHAEDLGRWSLYETRWMLLS